MPAILLVLLFALSASAQTPAAQYTEGFESYGRSARPAGWVNTPVEQLTASDAAEFVTAPDPVRRTNTVYGPLGDPARRRVIRAIAPGARGGTFATLADRKFT